MSKGSTIVPVRFPQDLLTEIENAILTSAQSRFLEPYNTSEWIRKACKEKLAHLKRARKRKVALKRDESAAGDSVIALIKGG